MKKKLTIEGMHCASCATNIERALKKVPGIGEVSVALMLKKATIEAESFVSNQDIEKAIARTGYKVTKIE